MGDLPALVFRGPETKAKGYNHLHPNGPKAAGYAGQSSGRSSRTLPSQLLLLGTNAPGEVCHPLRRAGLEAKGSEKVFGINTKRPHPPPKSCEIRAGETIRAQSCLQSQVELI